MDIPMQDAAVTASRKRSTRQWGPDSDTEETNNFIVQDDQDTSPKRLRNRKGSAIHRHVLKYNAQRLLNSLAFTHLFVTANFQNFNPSSSPIIICIVTRRVELYNGLSAALPELYSTAPNLQAVAISPEPGIQKVVQPLPGLPILGVASVGEDVLDDLRDIRKALHDPEDAMFVVDASHTCTWTSAELDRNAEAECITASTVVNEIRGALLHSVHTLVGTRMDFTND